MSELVAADPSAQPISGEPRARVLVAGVTGLSGALAARLIWRHPRLELVAATSRSQAGRRLDELYPRHRVPITLTELDLRAADEVEAAVVALPHGASAPVVAELRGLGALVVDLSADFRLRDLTTYERWYAPHGEPDLLSSAVYGLTELNRAKVREAELVANPGCYPTAAMLALAPLAEAGACAEVIVDAKSGVSGAGRGGADFADVVENFKPYGLEGHRHSPELEQELRALGYEGTVTFVPHLLPLDQGLLASCYVTPSREIGSEELRALYEARYAGEPFIDLVDVPPGVRDVRETNVARVHARLDERSGRVLAFCAIDNLWKGASGQALQNLNLMLGLPETEGLV
ncbi:MAG: N-acetyl-gamma-glutamyl-phosphate reductase [bacterium]